MQYAFFHHHHNILETKLRTIRPRQDHDHYDDDANDDNNNDIDDEDDDDDKDDEYFEIFSSVSFCNALWTQIAPKEKNKKNYFQFKKHNRKRV